MRIFHKILPIVVVVITMLCASSAIPADDKKKPVKPPTKVTQVIRPENYKIMEAAQKAFDAKDYSGALQNLDALKVKSDKLNDYEKATLSNLYAAVYYSKGDNKSAIGAYTDVLKQPNLPEGIRDNALYALGQLYFITEDYPKAITVIKKWQSVVSEPAPDGYVLVAQAYYQQQKYKDAEQELIQALRLAKQKQQTPKENWLALLRATYYELKDYNRSAKVLEILLSLYPGKESYWQQLSGMYGLLDRQPDQMKILHAAYQARLVSSETDRLNLARLYLVQEAPYPAVEVITKGMREKVIKIDANNLQLLAQALALAREYEKQIPVLKKLTEMTSESKHYLFLGQAYEQTNDWKGAVEAFRSALKAKGVERVATIEMQLGTALYNDNKLNEAKEAFQASVAAGGESATAAAGWVKFVTTEIERKKAIKGE